MTVARPAHKPEPVTRRQVEAMAGYGVPESDIARVVGVDPKTLRKHYREELDTGHVKANAKVAENLFRKATGEGREAVIAAILWLKTRAGWKETQDVVVTGTISAEPVLDAIEWERRYSLPSGEEPTRTGVAGRLLSGRPEAGPR